MNNNQWGISKNIVNVALQNGEFYISDEMITLETLQEQGVDLAFICNSEEGVFQLYYFGTLENYSLESIFGKELWAMVYATHIETAARFIDPINDKYWMTDDQYTAVMAYWTQYYPMKVWEALPMETNRQLERTLLGW